MIIKMQMRICDLFNKNWLRVKLTTSIINHTKANVFIFPVLTMLNVLMTYIISSINIKSVELMLSLSRAFTAAASSDIKQFS